MIIDVKNASRIEILVFMTAVLKVTVQKSENQLHIKIRQMTYFYENILL